MHVLFTEKRCLQQMIIRMDLKIFSYVITAHNDDDQLFHCVTGPHCETCAFGYFGDAKNGGTCKGTVTVPVLCGKC